MEIVVNEMMDNRKYNYINNADNNIDKKRDDASVKSTGKLNQKNLKTSR